MSATALLRPASHETRKRFTRTEVDQLLDTGIFTGLRFELIHGDLIDKVGQGPPHANSIDFLSNLFWDASGRGRIRIQSPLEVAMGDREFSLPEPDLVVLAEPNDPRESRYGSRHPRGDETTLVVEVADSSLRQDLEVKSKLYARASVPEYWVLDVTGRRLVMHGEPKADGSYGVVKQYSETDKVGPFRVAEMLP